MSTSPRVSIRLERLGYGTIWGLRVKARCRGASGRTLSGWKVTLSDGKYILQRWHTHRTELDEDGTPLPVCTGSLSYPTQKALLAYVNGPGSPLANFPFDASVLSVPTKKKAWEEHIAGCEGQCSTCHCNHNEDGCTCTRHFVWEETPGGRVKRFFEGKCDEYKPEEGHEHCGPGEDDDAGSE